MTKAIVIHEHGGPEVFNWEDVEVGAPGPGEIRLRHTAMGLNYRDTYHREGTYPIPGLPRILGGDGAGVVEEIGPDVEGLQVGQRVVYAFKTMGSYCQVRLIRAEHVLPIPDEIDDQTAAAAMIKGMTAQYLLRQTYPVKPGETILVQAAAGGVGLIMCQWAKHLGCTVIGTVGSEEKAAFAGAHGCDYTINYRHENFAERVREITAGEGVAVVYDGVGKDTFMGSLDSLRPRGLLAGYGNASGNFPEFDPLLLMNKGSLYFTRTTVRSYDTSRETLEQMGGEVLGLIAEGTIRIEVTKTYPLRDVGQAHRDLEARKTMGSVVLLP